METLKPAATELSSEQHLKMLEQMLMIREFEIFAKKQMNAGKQGSRVTVVAVQRMVLHALRAAESLSNDGIEAELTDPRTLLPLYEKTITGLVKKTRALVMVDEDQPRCSISADITAIVGEKCFGYLEAPIERGTPPHAHASFCPRWRRNTFPAQRGFSSLSGRLRPPHE